MEIDEKTRFRADYVRVKIACRDVQKVPRTTEGTLGIHLHDFIFEREIQEGQTIKTLNSGIKIIEKGPDPKRMKADEQPKALQLGGPSNQGGNQINNAGSSKGPQQQKTALGSSLAPKLQGSKSKSCQDKVMDQGPAAGTIC